MIVIVISGTMMLEHRNISIKQLVLAVRRAIRIVIMIGAERVIMHPIRLGGMSGTHLVRRVRINRQIHPIHRILRHQACTRSKITVHGNVTPDIKTKAEPVLIVQTITAGNTAATPKA